jgi:hypothetical protein
MLQMIDGLFWTLALTLSAQAGPAHNHSEVKILIAQEQGKGVIDTTLPAVVVLGFEHSPRNPREVKKSKEALENLKVKAPQWFLFGDQSQCRLLETTVDWIKDQSEHSEIRLKINFNCQKTLLGNNLKIQLRDTHPEVKTIHVEALIETLQKSWVLNKKQNLIEFKP